MTDKNDNDPYMGTDVDGKYRARRVRSLDNLLLEQYFITFMNRIYTAKRSDIMKEPIARKRVKKAAIIYELLSKYYEK